MQHLLPVHDSVRINKWATDTCLHLNSDIIYVILMTGWPLRSALSETVSQTNQSNICAIVELEYI